MTKLIVATIALAACLHAQLPLRGGRTGSTTDGCSFSSGSSTCTGSSTTGSGGSTTGRSDYYGFSSGNYGRITVDDDLLGSPVAKLADNVSGYVALGGDSGVVRTSSTVLTIFPRASSTSPVRFSFGSSVCSFSAPATVTISAGSDTAYIQISPACAIQVLHNADALVCNGCTLVPGQTAFGPNASAIWTWTAGSGTWGASGGVDKRALYGTRAISAGNGVTVSDAAGVATVGAKIPVFFGHSIFNPADGATYFAGFPGAAPTITTALLKSVFYPVAGNVTRIDLYITGAAGSAEPVGVYFRHNNTTDVTIDAASDWSGAGIVKHYVITPTPFAVTTAQSFELKYVCPTWVTTNPTNVSAYAHVLVE